MEVAIPASTEHIRLLKADAGPLQYHQTTPWANPPLSILRRMMPHRIKAPPHHIKFQVPNESPVFVFSLVDSEGRYPSKITHRTHLVEFVESTGFVHSASYMIGQSNVVALVADSIPRRDSQLHMRIKELFGYDLRSHPIEFRLPNPFHHTQVSEWSPDPVGKTVTQDELTVTLKGISVNPRPPTINSVPQYSLLAQFDIKSEKLEWDDAQIDYVFQDATGNRGRWLSPFEPTWKVVATVRRHPEAPHPDTMITDLGRITIPPPGEIQTLNKTVNVDGFQLRLVCVCGGGTVIRNNDKITVSPPVGSSTGISGGGSFDGKNRKRKITCNRPFLLYESDSIPAGRNLFLRQNSFRVLRLGAQNTDNSCVELFVAPGESEYSLELVDSRSMKFEFTVSPPEHLKMEMMDLIRSPKPDSAKPKSARK